MVVLQRRTSSAGFVIAVGACLDVDADHGVTAGPVVAVGHGVATCHQLATGSLVRRSSSSSSTPPPRFLPPHVPCVTKADPEESDSAPRVAWAFDSAALRSDLRLHSSLEDSTNQGVSAAASRPLKWGTRRAGAARTMSALALAVLIPHEAETSSRAHPSRFRGTSTLTGAVETPRPMWSPELTGAPGPLCRRRPRLIPWGFCGPWCLRGPQNRLGALRLGAPSVAGAAVAGGHLGVVGALGAARRDLRRRVRRLGPPARRPLGRPSSGPPPAGKSIGGSSNARRRTRTSEGAVAGREVRCRLRRERPRKTRLRWARRTLTHREWVCSTTRRPEGAVWAKRKRGCVEPREWAVVGTLQICRSKRRGRQ